jgi:hypothetical protein
MSRSLLRPDQLDSNGSYNFAQLIIDGYSGGYLEDGYLTGLIFQDRANGNTTKLEIHAATGQINQTGTGQVSFAGNVDATSGLDVSGADLTVSTNAFITGNTTIGGDLIVNGTTTTINTAQMIVTDPITILNASGNEITSKWTGFSARDTDGYNRLGWIFSGASGGPTDGYWGISVNLGNSNSDLIPNRAIAYIGAGDGYADLSSKSVNSGASKIGVHSGILDSTNVQDALEEVHNHITSVTSGIAGASFTINNDANYSSFESACLVQKGGSGTALADSYLCLIPDDVNGDRFQLTMHRNGSLESPRFDVGALGGIGHLDAYFVLNGGDGSNSRTASLKLDGNSNKLVYSAAAHEFINNVTMDNGLTITGTTTTNGSLQANGDTILGNTSSDSLTITATIVSNLLPTNNSYYLGSTAHKWVDGYFNFVSPTNYTPIGSIYSLEGHLRGIDAKLADSSVTFPRGLYTITASEDSTDSLNTTRAVNQGTVIDVGDTSITDAIFANNIFVYHNGQLLVNDTSSAAGPGSVVNDVARKTGSLGILVFGENIRKGAHIQIVDMR